MRFPLLIGVYRTDEKFVGLPNYVKTRPLDYISLLAGRVIYHGINQMCLYSDGVTVDGVEILPIG